MTEETQSAIENPTVVLPPQDLFMLMRRIRKNRPNLKMNQNRIARDLRSSQGYISLAMREPEKVPQLAMRVYDYLMKFDSQTQSKESPAIGA